MHDDEIIGNLRYIGEWLAIELAWVNSANTLFTIADQLEFLGIGEDQ